MAKEVKRFKVIEDNGGGLSLFVFGADGAVEYTHCGYEYHVGQLSQDLKALQNGADPVKEWDGNCGGMDWEFGEDPQKIYDELVGYEYGWDLVADNAGIYPDRMGGSAREEFGVK